MKKNLLLLLLLILFLSGCQHSQGSQRDIDSLKEYKPQFDEPVIAVGIANVISHSHFPEDEITIYEFAVDGTLKGNTKIKDNNFYDSRAWQVSNDANVSFQWYGPHESGFWRFNYNDDQFSYIELDPSIHFPSYIYSPKAYSEDVWVNLLTSHITGKQVNTEDGTRYNTFSFCNITKQDCFEIKSDTFINGMYPMIDLGNHKMISVLHSEGISLGLFDFEASNQAVKTVEIVHGYEIKSINVLEFNEKYYLLLSSDSGNELYQISSELELIAVDEIAESSSLIFNDDTAFRVGANGYILQSGSGSCNMSMMTYVDGAFHFEDKKVSNQNNDTSCSIKGVDEKLGRVYIQSWKNDSERSSIVITDLHLNILNEFMLPKRIDVDVSFINEYSSET